MPKSHTPGPWIADSWYVGPKDLPTLIKVNPNGPLGHEEVIANARLIAAAPDLLDALLLCKRFINGGHDLYPGLHHEAYVAARDAITRATGA